MSRKNSFILGLLFVILVIEIIILAPKEAGLPPEATAPTPPPSNGMPATGQVMKDVYSVEAKNEGKEWELWADQAIRPSDNQEWSIGRVKVKFYAMNGVTYTVTGKLGNVVPNEKGIRDIKITGNVVTKSSNGYTFKTESIFYDSQVKKLTSPTSVEMISPADKDGGELQLTGGEMVAEFATNEIEISKGVKAKKKIRNDTFKDKTALITAERAKFSGRTKMAQFTGAVSISVDTMTIAGPAAKFAYDTGMESIQSVLVDGGVKMTDEDKFATSQMVNVNFKEDTIVLKGAPRVVQKGDELVGDEIVFRNGGRKVQVLNAKAQLEPENRPEALPPQKSAN